jgi:rhodanese-related sulfurtransferase
MSVPIVSPHLLDEQTREGTDIEMIDVRTPVELQELHVPGSRLVPLDRLDPEVVRASRTGKPGDPLYILCKSGRSRCPS